MTVTRWVKSECGSTTQRYALGVRVRVRVTELGSLMVSIGLHHRLDFGRGGEVRCFTPPLHRACFLAVTRCQPGSFRIFLAHQNRETVAQLSYSCDFPWFGLLRPQFAIYWFLGIWGT